MPDFLGIGAQKAGTTWLYFALAHHPQIFMPDCKEVHFWDQHYEKGYGWYEELFEDAGNESGLGSPPTSVPRSGLGSSASQQASRERTEKRTGEITPAYAILPAERIAEIRQHYPRLHLIYMVRDPLVRAWSSALMALRRAEMRVDEASDAWFLDHFRSAGSRARGDYAACLRAWLAHYPKEQFLLLHYDGIARAPRPMLKAAAAHIGVEEAFFDALDEAHLARRRNEGTGQPLRPSLRAALEELYTEKQKDFTRLLKETGMAVLGA